MYQSEIDHNYNIFCANESLEITGTNEVFKDFKCESTKNVLSGQLSKLLTFEERFEDLFNLSIYLSQ